MHTYIDLICWCGENKQQREKITFFMPLVFFDEVSCSWSAFLFYKKRPLFMFKEPLEEMKKSDILDPFQTF